MAARLFKYDIDLATSAMSGTSRMSAGAPQGGSTSSGSRDHRSCVCPARQRLGSSSGLADCASSHAAADAANCTHPTCSATTPDGRIARRVSVIRWASSDVSKESFIASSRLRFPAVMARWKMRSDGPAGAGSGRSKGSIASACSSSADQSAGAISSTDRISLWYPTPGGLSHPETPQTTPPPAGSFWRPVPGSISWLNAALSGGAREAATALRSDCDTSSITITGRVQRQPLASRINTAIARSGNGSGKSSRRVLLLWQAAHARPGHCVLWPCCETPRA